MDPDMIAAGVIIHALGVLALANPTVRGLVANHATQMGFGGELARLVEAIAEPKGS